ncbi:hypothetical protein [Bradyrhizobium sp. 2S1]|uniref:hypothetical protein n=1 Tax=Bradyrhizobium sp. 2S1 TaxID=1404429 RepID=UPI00140B2D86|nr:hypothetical protein [Bradyrhizobium sp. 2S1]MCK7669175.1 hypothetical protein [Bradyrhizobium sp. 2S1]
MSRYVAKCEIWNGKKLALSKDAIPMEGEAACYRTAGQFTTIPGIAFIVFQCDGVEFFRVPGKDFWANKKAIQAAHPGVWRDAPKGKGGPGALRRRAA